MKRLSLLMSAVVLSAAVAFAGDGGKKEKRSAKKEACAKESSCCASKKSAKADEAKAENIVSKEEIKQVKAIDAKGGEVIRTDKKFVLSEK